MKHLLIPALFICTLLQSADAKPTDFSLPSILFYRNANVFAFGDLNNDSCNDAVCNFYDSSLVIRIVRKGVNRDTVLQQISRAIQSLDIGDADRDGDNDILVGCGPSAAQAEKLYILKNTSTGVWADTIRIPTTLSSVITARFISIDQDNDPDVVVLGAVGSAGKLLWFEQSASGWTEHAVDTLIATGTTGLRFWMSFGNFNSDSSIDLVAGTYGGTNYNYLYLYRNNGSGVFTRSSIVNNFGGSVSGAAGDLNFDGLCDVFIGKQWFENSGTGTFTQRDMINPPPKNAQSVAVGDFNNDGYPDCASADYDDGIFIWHSVGGTTFTRSALVSTPGVNKFITADINSDGFTDIACVNDARPGTVEWLQNLATFAFDRKVLCTDTGLVTFDCADFDTDGDADLMLYAEKDPWYDHKYVISVMENKGGSTFAKRFTRASAYASSTPRNILITAGDFDGDGNPDAVMQAGSLHWYQQTSLDNFARQGIAATGDSLDKFFIADFNGDRRNDLIAHLATARNEELGWFKNNGASDFTYTRIFYDDLLCAAGTINSDSLGDFVTRSKTTAGVSRTSVHFGKGDGTFTSKTIDSSQRLASGNIAIADLDRDGDMDLAASSSDSSRFGWFENMGDSDNDGYPEFATRVGAFTVANASAIGATELDNDSRPDLLVRSETDSTLYWMRQGREKWFIARLLVPFNKAKGKFRAIDFDKDGWIDILGIEGNSVVWFRNLLGIPPAKPTIPVAGRFAPAFKTRAEHVNVAAGGPATLRLTAPAPFPPGSSITLLRANGQRIARTSLDNTTSSLLKLPMPLKGMALWSIADCRGVPLAKGRLICP